MKLQEKITTGVAVLIYGSGGIGKSTLASKAKDVVFIDVENGLRQLPDVQKTPIVKTWPEFEEHLREFFKSEFKTVCIDSIDYLEAMLHKHICDTNNWKSMEQAGYGKAYTMAQEAWCKFLGIVDHILTANKNIIILAHETIRTFDAPDQDAYDKYTIKLHPKSVNLICAKMDAVLFAQLETIVKTDRGDEERLRAITTGKRILRTVEAPAYLAKNRFNLAIVEPLDEKILEKMGL